MIHVPIDIWVVLILSINLLLPLLIHYSVPRLYLVALLIVVVRVTSMVPCFCFCFLLKRLCFAIQWLVQMDWRSLNVGSSLEIVDLHIG